MDVMSEPPFLAACNGRPASRTPVWFMRQAGRSLPEYRELRKAHPRFDDVIHQPELAAEVTLQPVRRFGVDAAILFSDLLSRAFDSWLLPLLGFFLLPWTTLAYAVMWKSGVNDVSGFEWFIVILGFVADLGSYAGGRWGRAQRA